MKRTSLLALFFAFVFSVGVSAQDMNKDAALLYNDGNNLMKSGDYNGAIANYNKAINIDKDYRIYYQLGIALKKAGKMEDAKTAFENSLKNKQDFDLGYNGLGGVNFALNNFETAIDNFEKLKTVTKNKKLQEAADEYIARCYTKLGTDALTGGSAQKSVDLFKKAVEHYNYDVAYLYLSQAYVELGQYDEAISAADKAINHRDTIAKGAPYYYKGLAFKNKGDMAKARENFNAGKDDPKYKKLIEYEMSMLQ
jgi:tetratricopeptide (TPR) repeat protein